MWKKLIKSNVPRRKDMEFDKKLFLIEQNRKVLTWKTEQLQLELTNTRKNLP